MTDISRNGAAAVECRLIPIEISCVVLIVDACAFNINAGQAIDEDPYSFCVSAFLQISI